MGKARSAIILTDYRTGGTFLSLALDSHPHIFCARAEPLSKTSMWWDYLGDSKQILDILFRQECSRVNVVKIIYRQVGPELWKYLVQRGVRVIHLVRENELRASCSFLFHKKVRVGQVSKARRKLHVYTSIEKRTLIPKPMPIEPNELLTLMRKRVGQRKKNLQVVKQHKLPLYRVTYEELIGESMEASRVTPVIAGGLCRFLKVPTQALVAPTRRVNAYPLWTLISNWPVVEKVIAETEFVDCLEKEKELWQ